MLRIKDLSVLIVLLSGILLYSCGENEKSSDTWDVAAAVVQDNLPIYVFESEEMGLADSLFWAFELEEAEEIYDSIDSDQLSDIEKSIYFQRQTFSAARDRKMDLADSLQLNINLDSTAIASYWNISLGHKLTQGICSYWNRENEESRIYFEDAFIQLSSEQLQNPHWSAYIAHRLGLINFYRIKDAFVAKEWYEKEEELLRRLGNQNDLYYLLYSNLAACHRNIGDYEGALSYCLLSEEYLSKYADASPRLEPFLYGEFANNYFYLGDTTNMIKYYDKALKLYSENPALRGDRIRLTNTYGRLCRNMGLVEKTNSIYLELESLLDITDTLSIIRHLELQAGLAELKSEKENAIKYQREAMEIHQKYSGYDSLKQSILLTNIGLIYQAFKDHESAIKSFEKSLSHQFGDAIEISNYMESLTGKNYLVNGGFKFELSPIAYSLQNLHLEGKENISNLKLAQRYYDYLQEVFDDMSKQRGQGVVLRDLESFQKIFGEAISCSYRLKSVESQYNQSNRIFDSMERSKAALLYESILTKTLARQMGIPNELIMALEKLNDQKIQLEAKLIQEDLDNQHLINKEILTVQNKLNELRDKIDFENPRFFQSFSINKISPVDEVANWASTNKKCIVQYHWSPAGLFGLSILPSKEVKIKKIKNPIELEKEIIALLKFIRAAPDAKPQKVQEFVQLSNSVGRALFDDLLPDNPNFKDLILIPDGLLSALPFELLTLESSESTNIKSIDFILKFFNISYAYSASTLLFSHYNKPQKSTASIGLFAFSDNKNLCLPSPELNQNKFSELPGSSKEIDAIASVFDGDLDFWKGTNATKENFIKYSGRFKILHLAMHAEASSEDRFANRIIFRTDSCGIFDPLYAYELNGLNLSAEMIFLSACETGRGVARPGEGVYSIARGFMTAGVSSIIMSLWNLEDTATLPLKISFYNNLKEGMAIDAALRKAKLDYLESSDEYFAHPYFWASLVSIGSTKAQFRKPFFN